MSKLLVFDFDGTLMDSRKDLTTAVNLMRLHYGIIGLSQETVTSYIGNGARKLVERALKGTDIDVDEALPIMKECYGENMCNETELYPGVQEGLRQLYDNGCHLAILTNKPQEFSKTLADHLGIGSYFKYIIGGGGEFALKPDPDALLYLMSETGTTAEDSWMIGDNYTDLEAGRNAGINRCLAAYGFGDKKEEEYDLKVDEFPQLVNHLL